MQSAHGGPPAIPVFSTLLGRDMIPLHGVASFVYVVPDHRSAMVDVCVTPDGDGRSRASVRYRMTSLSSGGDDYVRAFGEAFQGFMVHWEEAIQRHIVEEVPLVGT